MKPERTETARTETGRTDTERVRVAAELRDSPADYVKVAVCDLDGVLRGKYLDKQKLLSALDGGFGFCNVVFGWDSADQCYDNSPFTGWQSGYPDASVEVDVSTHRRIPWEEGRDFFLGDFTGPDGADLEVCPRRALRRVIRRAEEQGYAAKFGMEFEWFNFLETPASANEKDFRGLQPLTPGMFGYSILRTTHNQPFFDALLHDLRAFGVPLEGLHTETGPGVLEGAILYAEPLEAADRALLFKSAVKEIAHRFAILPTFMARWDTDFPGCSGHTHQSLWDVDGETNLFFEEGATHHMSPLFRSYLAGILELLPELLVLWAPTVNSYKRLVEGFWAPTTPTWGIDNRTVACRVIPGGPKSTRVEMRVPGSDVNPYLSVAACLGAGMWGVEHGLTLDRLPSVGSGYADTSAPRLPKTLQEATEALAGSAAARSIFGDAFINHYVATREWEWRQYSASVTDWEVRRYFEVI